MNVKICFANKKKIHSNNNNQTFYDTFSEPCEFDENCCDATQFFLDFGICAFIFIEKTRKTRKNLGYT